MMKKNQKLFQVGVLTCSFAVFSAVGQSHFHAILEGAEVVPPVSTAASGQAALILAAGGDRLEIMVQLSGLDLDGAQTPDFNDDVTGIHIVDATSGAVVFALLNEDGTTDDMNPFAFPNSDLSIDPVAGTVFSAWDMFEGSLPPGAAFMELGQLDINVLTAGNPAGEIRGQILPGELPETDPDVPVDSDGDGVPDEDDLCPDSDLSPTVVIGSYDSGVENGLYAEGCTIADLVRELANSAKNHGKFVSSVASLADDLKKQGMISGKESGAIKSAAAKSSLP